MASESLGGVRPSGYGRGRSTESLGDPQQNGGGEGSQLAQREREQEENIARLQNAVSEQEERLAASRRDGQELQEKLDGMKTAEERR